MASAKGSLQGLYRQKKKNGAGISKPKSKPTNAKKAATYGSDVVQPPALISHGGSLDLQDDYGKEEEVLRQFDMNMTYGPCIGITRLARLERAKKLGMNPPKDVENLLKGDKVGKESLWTGRL